MGRYVEVGLRGIERMVTSTGGRHECLYNSYWRRECINRKPTEYSLYENMADRFNRRV